MTWTDIDRAELNRDALRFPSDLTAREWALIAPLGPSAKRGGQPRTTDMRDVVEAILFIASGGCQWRMLPPCFPLVSTMRGCFCAWRDTGLLASINHALVMTAPKIEGREASPGAARSHSNG